MRGELRSARHAAILVVICLLLIGCGGPDFTKPATGPVTATTAALRIAQRINLRHDDLPAYVPMQATGDIHIITAAELPDPLDQCGGIPRSDIVAGRSSPQFDSRYDVISVTVQSTVVVFSDPRPVAQFAAVAARSERLRRCLQSTLARLARRHAQPHNHWTVHVSTVRRDIAGVRVFGWHTVMHDQGRRASMTFFLDELAAARGDVIASLVMSGPRPAYPVGLRESLFRVLVERLEQVA